MKARTPSLDVLRTFAILSVLCLHSLEFLTESSPRLVYLFSYGWIGVELFFVLSGFLIGDQAFRESAKSQFSVGAFIIKRVFRTFPLYYTVLLVYLLLKPAVGFPFNDNPIAYFFFIQNFLSPKDFVQSWSLCIEEQFYLLFPLAFSQFNLHNIRSFYWLLPGIFSTLYRCFLYSKGLPANTLPGIAYNYQFPLFTHLDGLSWGIFLASSFKHWSQLRRKGLFVIPGFVILILTLIYIKPSNLNSPVILSFQLLAIAFSLILIGTFDLKVIPFKLGFEKIAIYSYGLYLWNNLVARIIAKFLPHSSFPFKFSLFLLLSLFISVCTFHLIENPFMKMRIKVLQKFS